MSAPLGCVVTPLACALRTVSPQLVQDLVEAAFAPMAFGVTLFGEIKDTPPQRAVAAE
jgi:hypothetical protein